MTALLLLPLQFKSCPQICNNMNIPTGENAHRKKHTTEHIHNCSGKTAYTSKQNSPNVRRFISIAVNFNEAMKKAFQWWIVCSSLDTSNFISHRLNSSTLRINVLCTHCPKKQSKIACVSEKERDEDKEKELVRKTSIEKESDFYLKRKMFGIAVTKQVSFQVLRTTTLCVTVFALRFYCVCCCCCCSYFCLVTVRTSFLNAIHKFHTEWKQRNVVWPGESLAKLKHKWSVHYVKRYVFDLSIDCYIENDRAEDH